uniref:Uncharacterized protein n=1 Tax=Schlesneria paludicola TaxID=360056 RepID=A0A7C2P516_9PLAN
MELRRQAEAVEARGETPAAPAKAKKATTAKTKRTKEKAIVRKRLIWVVYNGSMKEEGRFPYDQRAAAEEKIEQLRQKSKKLYFIQPVKEVIGADPSTTVGLAAAAAVAASSAKVAALPVVEEEDIEIPEDIAAEAEEEEEEEEEDEDEE